MRKRNLKQLVLASAVGLLAVSANAQNNSTSKEVVDSVITYKLDGTYFSKSMYEYDEKGNQIEEANYRWIAASEEWRGVSKQEREYDAKGNKISEDVYRWDNTTLEWVIDLKSKYDREYDVKGNETLSADYNWNIENSEWVGDGVKEETQFDANDNQILNAIYGWNSESKKWEGLYKNTSEYDDKGNETLFVS